MIFVGKVAGAWLLVAVFSLNLFQSFFALDDRGEFNWLLWDITREVSPLLCSIFCYRLIHFQYLKAKLLCALCVVLFASSVLSYALLTFVGYTTFLSSFSLFLAFLPFLGLYFYNMYFASKVPYSDKGTFLVYRKPKTFLGALLILFGARGLGVYVVNDGDEFSYKKNNGELVVEKSRHCYSRGNCYYPLDYVDVNKIKATVGEKWSLINNCHVVFRNLGATKAR